MLLACVSALGGESPDLASNWQVRIGEAIALRDQGELRQAIDVLNIVRRQTTVDESRFLAVGELGIVLLLAHQYDPAEQALRQAYDFFADERRSHYAFHLGNLYLLRQDLTLADAYHRTAIELATDQEEVRLLARLNRLRFIPREQRPTELHALSSALMVLGKSTRYARHHLNLGDSARQAQLTELAWRHLDVARRLADSLQSLHMQLEVIDALAQLYEDQGRADDAWRLTERGLVLGRTPGRSAHTDLMINLEWRAARLLRTAGQDSAALAAYLRAVELIELVRPDIPIDYEDGRSSFRATLEPIFLGYADLMLRQTETAPPAAVQDQLRTILETIELIKQAEMQDFLGDRCAVEAVQGGSVRKLLPGTAVLYPLLLPDRLELLLETSTHIVRQTQQVESNRVRQTATLFAATLRNGSDNFKADAQQLHRWLLAPVEEALVQNKITTLIVVPDGVLRLLPFGALFDGKQFAIEKYAISTTTGLSMTSLTPPTGDRIIALMAGVSEPGAVVEKLSDSMAAQILEPDAPSVVAVEARGLASTRATRAIRSATLRSDAKPAGASRSPQQMERLKDQLALPGVKDEIEALARVLAGPKLLNADFTISRFRSETESGGYQILHIASHGVFGGSAESSFIMAHDDILTMNGLQSLLRAETLIKNPIELLSLSACQTAEGNDRSPLGLSGAAIKARAKSVLGTLWSVEDMAAKNIMERFYTGIVKARQSKAEALRQAQLSLLHSSESAHPFFWAPFVLIGNWQ
jgi:CHAT domain-containing protein/tetratricopeptide (TPR) repeat protein